MEIIGHPITLELPRSKSINLRWHDTNEFLCGLTVEEAQGLIKQLEEAITLKKDKWKRR